MVHKCLLSEFSIQSHPFWQIGKVDYKSHIVRLALLGQLGLLIQLVHILGESIASFLHVFSSFFMLTITKTLTSNIVQPPLRITRHISKLLLIQSILQHIIRAVVRQLLHGIFQVVVFRRLDFCVVVDIRSVQFVYHTESLGGCELFFHDFCDLGLFQGLGVGKQILYQMEV